MKTYRNTDFKKRDYECTNVVYAQGEHSPARGHWVECDPSEMDGKNMIQLWIECGIRYFGWL